MDSSGSDSKNGAADELLSSSSTTSNQTERTDSESCEKETRFVLPSVEGNPEKILTVNEVVNVVNNIQKMEIVHEIALNPDFKLQLHEPPKNSLEKRIKDTMHKAFWDVLREQLNRDPPCYDHAMQLLTDIKECLPEIIPASNQRTLDYVNEILDTTIIKQQAEQGVLNVRSYADFIIQIMAKSCAPIRDEQIKNLSKIEDVVETFKEILETMTIMKLDVANWLLELAKKDVLANSVEYEKEKFREYLKYYKFGFPATESWLRRNQMDNNTPDETIYNAYMELLEWDNSYEFPELLSADKNRLLKLKNEVVRLCVCSSIMAVCSGIPVISLSRPSVANQVQILLQNFTTEEELKNILENIWLQLKSKINSRLQEEKQQILEGATENTIKAQILELKSKESSVRRLIGGRLNTYMRLTLNMKFGLPPCPPSFSDFREELEGLANAFRRITTYNYSVFGDCYVKILTENGSSSVTSNAQNLDNTKTVNSDFQNSK